MKTIFQDQFIGLANNIVAYLPNLFGGILLIIIGWLLGWMVKRVLVQISIILRVDRFLKKTRWEVGFSKADVRYSLYNLIGNIGFVIIFLIFLANAFVTWRLNILSDILSDIILFLPRIIIALIIFGLGWLLASWVQISLMKSLYREEVPRASLIARFVKIVLIIFFSAISFVELDVAREIIIIGFTTIFVTLGAIAVVITAHSGKGFIKKLEEAFKEESKKGK